MLFLYIILVPYIFHSQLEINFYVYDAARNTLLHTSSIHTISVNPSPKKRLQGVSLWGRCLMEQIQHFFF
jgi:hypothetical protein